VKAKYIPARRTKLYNWVLLWFRGTNIMFYSTV